MEVLHNGMNSRQANLHETIDNLSLFSDHSTCKVVHIDVSHHRRDDFLHFHILPASHSIIFLVAEILSLTQSSYLIDGAMTFQ